ncbi:MAG: 1-deoxy-D-xylulose-5-phosphate reductoisomerase [Clostridiales bacterium]|jgi:1-deoxy-D-xylulose-5-phosphate reductoisomerase|nr:1-deoxy-D-xylulose-5-phosphate reductoisomerase [Clostridiales bacterium]
MTETLVILGSTGSIGTQALDVCGRLGVNVCGLSAHSNIDLLESQINEFHPRAVCVMDAKRASEMKRRVGGVCAVVSGMDGLLEIASMPEADTILNALVGIIGLRPALAAIESGKNIALANKETMVSAGELVMRRAREKRVKILPVDSEHSAIFQCLRGNEGNRVKTVYLTASGGPFRKKTKDELKRVTVSDALKHPNWVMGHKITIDSASLMNKGLEFIEAMRLFDLRADQVTVLIHPESVIHSMVEYEDGAIIAQLGVPDMRLPIQYALAYPNRPESGFNRLNPLTCPALSFEPPDTERFPCPRLAFEAADRGGLLPAVMNGANEEAVAAFLRGGLSFTRIPELIEYVMGSYNNTDKKDYSADDVLDADKWARDRAREYLGDN